MVGRFDSPGRLWSWGLMMAVFALGMETLTLLNLRRNSNLAHRRLRFCVESRKNCDIWVVQSLLHSLEAVSNMNKKSGYLYILDKYHIKLGGGRWDNWWNVGKLPPYLGWRHYLRQFFIYTFCIELVKNFHQGIKKQSGIMSRLISVPLWIFVYMSSH